MLQILALSFAAALVLMIPSSAFSMTLAAGGQAKCSIVVGKDAIAPEKTAAYELRDYLKQVTGVDFKVVSEGEATGNQPQILVGPSDTLKSLVPQQDWKSLGHDGIIIKTVGNKLILAGGRTRGTLYAVYTFLEDVIGCRWWTATEGYIPKKPNLEIGNLDVCYTPKLRYREAYYRDPLENPKFAAKLKLNGNFYKIPREYGSHYEIIGWCHTFFHFLPPDKYFAQHPEWYSEINGKRSSGHTQLCLTNEEARRELTRIVLEKIKENPTAGIVSVSQNDWHGRCECAKCMELEKKEGSPSGPLIHFVNAVAQDVEKEFPDVLIETLAYQYTRKPPLHVKPRNNVVVRLCSIECSFTHPLDSEANKDFRDDILKWKAISPNLYIWDYVTNFCNYIFPHPNLRVIAPNIRFFEKNNVIGVFEQGDCATTVGDFVRLRAYVFAHLLWDPSADEKKLVREFMNGYYGAAGPYLEQYLDYIHNCCEVKNARIGCYHHDTTYLTYQDIVKATELFNKAEKAVASDPVIAKRVRRERMPLDHVWLLRYNELKEYAERNNLPFTGPKDGRAACDEFIRLAREWDARNYSEAQGFEAYVPGLQTRFAPPPPKPEEIDKLPGEDCIVIQQDKFQLANPDNWVKLVDDRNASDGKAACMPGSHTQWAVQYHINDELISACEGNWHCYIIARTEGVQSGSGFRYGVYNQTTNSEMVSLDASLEKSRGDNYRSFYAGTFKPAKGQYIWVAPCANGGAVKGIYVDRVVFVRQKG